MPNVRLRDQLLYPFSFFLDFDMYVATELEPEEIDIGEITFAVSANFWIKGFDIPILTLGLFYDETDFAFQLVTEENIQIFTDGWY